LTKILRNALLAAVAASALAGSAMADPQTVRTESDNTPTNKLWAGRCCGISDSNCLGGEGHDHSHDHSRAT